MREQSFATRESVNFFVSVSKAADEQTVTGVVLQPEETDAQGDIISAEVIKKAAHDFLAQYNKKTELGLMHTNFRKNFELYESWVAPVDLVLKSAVVKAGSWLITVKVKDSEVWKLVKDGKITGFSIGGKAMVTQVGEQE